MSMTIGRKIALAFCLVLLSFGVISSVTYVNTLALIDNNQWVVHTRAVLEVLETVLRTANKAEGSVLGFVMTGKQRLVDGATSARTQTDGALAELKLLTRDNSTQQRRMTELEQHVASYYESLDGLTRERQKSPERTIQSVSSSAYSRDLDDIRRLVGEIKATEQSLLAARSQSADAAGASSLAVISWGGVLTIALCLVIGAMLTLSIVRPVRALVLGAAEIGAGNLHYQTRTGTSDELGALGDAFNAMASSLSRSMVTADTEKDARARVEALLETISETAAHLVTATSEIVGATTQQAAGAREQVAAVEQTVTTVNEVVLSAQEAKERAHAVAKIAAESVSYGKSGRHVVHESLRAMTGLRELVEQSANRTLELGEHAQAIGSVIQGVTDIAEQTNVLALNAAIEAAQAGDEARVFRLVATRVKILAEESKHAADEVRRVLRQVATTTESLLSLAEQSSEGVVSASAVLAQADASISALAQIIDNASQTAAQIAASAGQQANGTAMIHESMKQISAVTVQNLGSTRQMELAAKDLNALGGRLRDRVASAAAPSA
jgi:methyl-accepting chemotaxis protein